MKIKKICLYTREISRLFSSRLYVDRHKRCGGRETFFVQPRHTHTHMEEETTFCSNYYFFFFKKEGGKREHETLLSNFHQCLALAGPWAVAAK
jgi:hypothetical protein